MAVVSYHASWPSSSDPFYRYNTSENDARVYYYPPDPDGYRYTPYGYTDGVYRGSSYTAWGSWIQARKNLRSPLTITLDGSFDEGTRTGNLNISIYAEDQITLNGLKVRIALTEDSLYFNGPNHTLWHNCTMRDMIPSATGITLNITQGQTVDFSQGFSVPEPLVIDRCRLVVWVQADQSNYEVLQAARTKVGDLMTSIDDGLADLPSNFQLNQNYPNPFNASTTIGYSLINECRTSLAVYDLAGRKVADLFNGRQAAGNYRITWNGADNNGRVVSSGVYFYRLIADGQSSTMRMMLLK